MVDNSGSTLHGIISCRGPEIFVQTRMWANAKHDGRPAEHRWRPLFNATKLC